jgi:hypothetical protein
MPKRKPEPAPLDLGPMPGKERRAIVQEYLDDRGLSAMVADGWDDCIVGLVETDSEPRIVYDLAAMRDVLMVRDGMDYQEAQEYLSYNVLGAFVMDPMPLYLERVDTL